MAIYKVQQRAEVWQEVIVEADSREQALAIGTESLMEGEGTDVDDLFEWQDDIYIEEMEEFK